MDIDSFISSFNIDSTKEETQIENIFDNILKETCYIFYDSNIVYNIPGISEKLILSDFTFLIPNLFRACYAQKSVSTPFICPTYNNPDNTVNYYPILINYDLIKSFLYFNFPCSIKYFNNNYDFINVRLTKLDLNKKKYTTYGSYTPSEDILYDMYNEKSLLIQLINFNSYLAGTDFANSQSLIINNFDILWDFTKSCISYSNSSNIYVISNYTIDAVVLTTTINQTTGYNLYSVQNGLLNYYKNGSVSTNGIVILQKESIFTILELVKEVYEDVINEIKYYYENKYYCK